MSPAFRPEAVPFDPGSHELPPALGPALTDPETRLLLVVATDAGDATVRAAIGLAEAREREGHPTVLADAAFDDPRLHQFLDTDNLEGLADVFEFGASIQRAITRPAGRSLEFVPSGPYVPDPAAVLGSDRWDRLAEELAASGKTMMVFTLAATPGLDLLSRRVGRAVIVGAGDVDAAMDALDPGCEVTAVVRPDSGLSAETGPTAPDLSEPLVFEPEEPRRRRPSLLRWVPVVVLAGVLAWAGYAFVVAPGGEEAAVEATPPPAAPEPEPRPVETPIGYSVAVEAHQDLGIAQDRAARLQREDPGVLFYLAPLSIRGALWYRVLAGPVGNPEEAQALMERLVDKGLKSGLEDWSIRPTRYAFLLGEYETSTEAANRVVVLAQKEIPAYIVSIRYEPGQPRFRVYAGAFANEMDAEVMQEMLREAGIDAPLVERVGEPIAVGS